MPANLTPDYQKAEERYRAAQSEAEKVAALEEMLRTLPKHKGTEKIQADLKRKLSEARDSATTHKKGGGKDPFHIPRQGAGQVMLLGAPNVGKSSIVGTLTEAPVKIAEFPFSTHAPVPGMAHHEDVPIQLIDLPPATPEHLPGAMASALRITDLIVVVGNIALDSVLEDVDSILSLLREKGIRLLSKSVLPEDGEEGVLLKKGLIIATGCDGASAADNLGMLREMVDSGLEILSVSTVTGERMDEVPLRLFQLLNVIRVYAKPPGKPADKTAPFLIPAGSNVLELAERIHKDIAAHFKFARIWGDGAFPGQQVHHDHILHDKDVIEIHV